MKHFRLNSPMSTVSVAAVVVFATIFTQVNGYYYNSNDNDNYADTSAEVDFDSGRGAARALYTRSIKSPPPPPSSRAKTYTPPAPARARLVSPVKGYEQQQQQPITQQRYEQQSYDVQQPVPVIQHDVVGQPEPYNFNYDVKDDYGNNQFRREEQDTSGTVRGSYGYTDANGLYRIVDYVADQDGFRASIRTNEPGLSEPNPKTGEVENPASVTLSAEQPPARVLEQQLRYSSQNSYRGGSSSTSSSSSSSTSSGTSSYERQSYTSPAQSQPIQQQRLRTYSEKY